MLFVSVGKPRGPYKPLESIARRVQWEYPPGINVLAEYWTQCPDFIVVTILEADSVDPILAITSEWGDMFAWTVVPAVTAEHGIEMFKSMAS